MKRTLLLVALTGLLVGCSASPKYCIAVVEDKEEFGQGIGSSSPTVIILDNETGRFLMLPVITPVAMTFDEAWRNIEESPKSPDSSSRRNP